MKKSLSSATLRRMTTYLAYLRSISERLPQYVSATMIASALHLGDVQVRKDLAKAAGPGHTKIGRDKAELIRGIEQSIGLDRPMRAVLVGSEDFLPWLVTQCGSHLMLLGCFGKNEADAMPMAQLSAFCKGNRIQIGIVNVSPDLLYSTAEILERGGVRFIWNFSSVPMAAREGMLVQNEYLLPALAVFSHDEALHEVSEKELA